MKNDQDFTEELGHSMPSSKEKPRKTCWKSSVLFAKRTPGSPFGDLRADGMTRREVLALSETALRTGLCKNRRKQTYVRLTELGCIRGEECRHRHETFTQFLGM